VFQTGYKAILLDVDAIGPVAHYIHLIPVRAAIVGVDDLKAYEASSFHPLWKPRKCWGCNVFECSLKVSGGLKDSPHGVDFNRGSFELAFS